jgi:hypothetical protein
MWLVFSLGCDSSLVLNRVYLAGMQCAKVLVIVKSSVIKLRAIMFKSLYGWMAAHNSPFFFFIKKKGIIVPLVLVVCHNYKLLPMV